MAKKKDIKNKNKSSPSSAPGLSRERITMKALNELSDSEDDDNDQQDVSQWSSKAKMLRQDIEGGKFDHLLDALKKAKKEGKDDEDEFEEDTLDSSNDSDEEEDNEDENVEEGIEEEDDEEEEENDEEVDEEEVENDDDEEEDSESEEEEEMEQEEQESENEEEEEDEEEEEREGADKIKEIFKGKVRDGDDSEEDDDEESEDEDDDESSEKALRMIKNNRVNSKALAVVTAELVTSHSHLPWAETFDIIPPTPLPFGRDEKPDPETGTSPLDIHDDLKREVAFYNCALEAIHEARSRCKKVDIPFSRPEDFFAEMIKTDDHMAKVKDRLIFETKKMDAVAQRKANREQKLRGKEAHANKLAEKAKRKRDHFQEVEEWANSAARSRGGALRDDADDMYLNGNKGRNKKREAADRKYGFGGKRGRFKQNDRASMNDTSAYNPRGNFPGGMKKTASTSKGGSGGAKRSSGGGARPGKRARDAKRARR